MRKGWIYATQIVLSLVVVCGLAISCAVPSSTSPPSSTPAPPTSSQTANENFELYHFTYWTTTPEGFMQKTSKTMMLKTIGSWQGSTSRDLHLKVAKSPWVINSGHKSTSQIESHFYINIRLTNSDLPIYPFGTPLENDGSLVVTAGTGDFIIMVDSSGCEWWVKVGVEP